MRYYRITALAIVAATILSCQSKSKTESSQPGTNENENRTSKTNNITKEDVRKAFLEYLNTISGGRQLSSSWETPEGKGYRILLGDLDGDGLEDAVVDYSLEPTTEDNGGGGNAIPEIPGLVAYLNTGEKLTMVDNNTDFVGRKLTAIKDGVIILEGLDYGPDDPRCCPSIKTTTRVVLRDRKLTELK